MSRHIGIRYSAVRGTAAGLGLGAGGHSVIADRPSGKARGQGLGFNGGELLAAALGGCFWNDLHYVADAHGVRCDVEDIEAEVEVAGNPPRIVRAHIAARLSGAPEATLKTVFDGACEITTIANSIGDAIPVAFDLLPDGDAA